MGWHMHGCGHGDGHDGMWANRGGRRGPSWMHDGPGWPFGGRGHGRGSGGGGPRSKRMFGSGELKLVLLKLIADEPRHGYDRPTRAAPT